MRVATSDAEPLVAGAKRSSSRRLRGRTLPGWIGVAGAFAAVSLALCLHQLATPGLLYGVYDGDDGVYFGGAVRLIDGVMPYRDFTVVHPPGITLLMAPLALAAHVVGTDVALAWARVLTAVVTAINVFLVGRLLRDRGLVAVAVGSGALAAFPMAVAADNTLLLEPYLVLFCLLGSVAAFDGGSIAVGRRLVWAGAAFGFAGTVKVWAIFPVLGLATLLLKRPRSLARFAAAVAAGFLIPAAPFVIAAPRAFFHDVVVTQLARGSSSAASLSLAQRLDYLTGAYGIEIVRVSLGAAELGAIALCALLAASLLLRPIPTLDAFLLLATAIIVTALLLAPEFYNHYAYFSAAFIAPLLAVRLDAAARGTLARAAFGSSRRALRAGAVVCVAIATAVVLPGDFGFSNAYLAASGVIDPAHSIDFYVPAGACFLSIDAVFALSADRFTSRAPGCPALDDSFGSWIALDPDHPPPSGPPYPAALVTEWSSWLRRANYFLYEPDNVKVPWTPELLTWFAAHYLLLTQGSGWQLYVHEA